jgi:hypothetical protein
MTTQEAELSKKAQETGTQQYVIQGNKMIVSSPEGIVLTYVGGQLVSSKTPSQVQLESQIAGTEIPVTATTTTHPTITPEVSEQIAEGLQTQSKQALAGEQPTPFKITTPEAIFQASSGITPNYLAGATGSIIPSGYYQTETGQIVPSSQTFKTSTGQEFTAIPVGSSAKGGFLWETPFGQVRAEPENLLRQIELKLSQEVSQGVVNQAVQSALYGGPDTMITPEEYAMQEELKLDIKNIYESATPEIKFALDIQPLFSPRGMEYIATYLPGKDLLGIKKLPGEIVQEQMLESVTNENFVMQQTIGSLYGSPTGILGTSLLTGSLIGGTLELALPKALPFLKEIPGLATAGSFLTQHPTLVLGTGIAITGGIEAWKLGTMEMAGVPREKIIGSALADITSIYGFSKGLEITMAEGFPFKYWGKEKVAPESIIEPDILSGKSTFPSAQESPGELVREFKTGKYGFSIEYPGGWHTTTSAFGKEVTIGLGGGAKYDSPGLYVSPSVSPHFLRFDRSLVGYSRAGLGTGGKALWINAEDVIRIPGSVRAEGFEVMNQWLIEEAERTKFYISPAFELGTKIEKEAIITPTSLMERTSEGLFGFEKYSSFKGIRFPIFEYELVGKGGEVASSLISKFTGLDKIFSYSEPYIKADVVFASGLSLLESARSSLIPSITPSIAPSVSSSIFQSIGSPGVSILSSITPSIIPSITPSIVPSFAPSVIPSIIPSVIPSIVPSIIPSIAPSIIPSLIPSLTPSIVPSILPKMFAFSLPEINLGFEEPRRKGKSRSRSFFYTPSFIALSLGIFGKQPKFLTGLEVRPLLKGMRGL